MYSREGKGEGDINVNVLFLVDGKPGLLKGKQSTSQEYVTAQVETEKIKKYIQVYIIDIIQNRLIWVPPLFSVLNIC